MKRLEQKDLLASAQRYSFSSSAKAAEVMQAADRFFQEHLPKKLSYRIRCWKSGTLYIVTEHAVGSQIIYSLSEELLVHLQERFPEYRFRSVRTEIGSLGVHQC